MKYNITFIIYLLVFSVIQAQDIQVKDILNRVTQNYDGQEKYQIDINYTMYRGFTGNNITESYAGKMIKNDDVTEFEALDSKKIQFPSIELIIDQKKKTMAYTKNSNGKSTNTPLDVISFLKVYDKTKVTEKGNTLICEMVSSSKNVQLSYGKVVLYIDKVNFQILKQELFFSNLIPFVNKEKNSREMDFARLIITMNHKDVHNIEKPKVSDYIVINESGGMNVSSTYKSYQFINQSN